MKKIGKILSVTLLVIALLIILVIAGLKISGYEYVIRAFSSTIMKGHTTTHIDDCIEFENNIIQAGVPLFWELDEQYNQIPLTDTLRKELETYKTIAFAIIKDGKLFYEEYWDNYSDRSLTNSFSMAKSVTTMLLGKAIEQGYIQSLEQPFTDFIPEFKSDSLALLCTIGDLSAMTSGLNWSEEYYSPFNPTTEAYFGDDVESLMLKQHFSEKPGGHFNYLSANTQLLAMVLQRATGMSISKYLEQEFWQPMGMEHDALWSKSGKMEKSFCCLNSNVRDFAKLGQLLLQQGNWNGQQLLDSAFVAKMVTPNYNAFDKDEPATYGYSMWIDEKHEPAFYGMMGHLGQRILVIPSENTVIVRLGKIKDKRELNKGPLDTDNYYYVEEVMKMMSKGSD